MMKPFIIHGIAEDAASAKLWLLGIEHAMTSAKGGSRGIHFEFRAALHTSVYSASFICGKTYLLYRECLGRCFTSPVYRLKPFFGKPEWSCQKDLKKSVHGLLFSLSSKGTLCFHTE